MIDNTLGLADLVLVAVIIGLTICAYHDHKIYKEKNDKYDELWNKYTTTRLELQTLYQNKGTHEGRWSR